MTAVPVLTYHHVAPDRAITPEVFETHLRWLEEKGYHTIQLATLEAHVAGTAPVSEKSLVLTFADAYGDNWVYAHPLLKKYGMTAALFIPTAFPTLSPLKRLTSEDGGAIADTRTMEHGPDGFLSWGEIKAMAASGVWELGAHTHTHRCFKTERPYASFEDEILLSRQTVERQTGFPCSAFAWPWGQTAEDWANRIGKSGYRLAFTGEACRNEPGDDLFGLGRTHVRQASTSWLADVLGSETLARPRASAPKGPSERTGAAAEAPSSEGSQA
ncbi:MAG: polysaccharide deacetylase family protein [Elusimicrobiota bacterium]|jgi:peptidoglycan/xylan/chitin deacetylase (PgdA/CDA1 family)